jgi:hypothetical protein
MYITYMYITYIWYWYVCLQNEWPLIEGESDLSYLTEMSTNRKDLTKNGQLTEKVICPKRDTKDIDGFLYRYN